jgi:uncharacterized protein YkwD
MTHTLTRTLGLLTCLTLSAYGFAGCGASGSRDGAGTAAGVSSQTQSSGDPAIVLNVAGTGSGTITFDPPSSTGRWPAGTAVTLTAAPDPGSTFGEWGGDLAGNTALSVSIVLQSDFTLAPSFVEVAAGTPVAEFTAGGAQGIGPLTVSFQDTSSGAPTAWIWDFGDGAQDTTQNPSHTYSQPGSYTVTLRAENANGMGTPVVKAGFVYVARPDEGSPFWYEGDRYGNPFKQNDATQDSLAQQVLALVNQERQNVGAPPLQLDAEAERAAKVHSEDMLGRNFFDHISPEGWDPSARLQMTGASGYSGFGENIALGQQTPAAVMTAWMNSPGHRANILNPTFTHLGVGIASGPRWTQVFLTR